MASAGAGQVDPDDRVVAGYTYAARYRYSEQVLLSDNFLRIAAYADDRQAPLSRAVTTTPSARAVQFEDRFGNLTHRVRLTAPHQELEILAIGMVRMAKPQAVPADVALEHFEYELFAERFVAPSPLVAPDKLVAAARDIAAKPSSLLECVSRITDWVHANITYDRGSTNVRTTAEDVLASGRGVCQDMTHLALGLLRSLGIPARYVSGLLSTQAGDTHAWLEFFHPREGWLPCDPTRGQFIAAGNDLLKFAVGGDYTQASPVEGNFVSRGSGWLEAVMAQVLPNGDSVSFDDARRLIDAST